MMQINVFELDAARFGIALGDTREVFRLPAITPLPGAPAAVEGVVNIRGRVVPVFNLRRRFGLPERKPHPNEHLLYATAGKRAVAMRVDRMIGIAQCADDQVVPPEDITSGPSLFAGIAKLADGLVMIHDLAAFLAEGETATLDSALRKAGIPPQ